MRWFVLAGLVAGSAPAMAQSAKVKKAEKMLAKYDASSEVKFLTKAWEALQAARTHPDTRDDPATWVHLGSAARHYVTAELDGPQEDMWETAWKAYDTAIGKGAANGFAEPVLEALAVMESTASAMATNAYEGERYEDAWAELDRALRCQTLIEQIGRMDPAKETATVQLALLTAVELGKLDDARELHQALDDLKSRRTGTTLSVARAIQEGEGPKSAEAFLAPYAREEPDDATLFATWVELLMELERTDEVRALLEEHASQVGNSPGITLVHAQTWAALRDLEKSNEAYMAALKIDGKNQEVLRGFGNLSLALGRDLNGQSRKAKRWKDRKALRQRRDESFMRAMTLLQTSRELEPRHLETLKTLREVMDEVRFDDRDEIAALEQVIADLEAGEDEGGESEAGGEGEAGE